MSEEIANIASRILAMAKPPAGSSYEISAELFGDMLKLAESALEQKVSIRYIEDRVADLERRVTKQSEILSRIVQGLKDRKDNANK